ncbi:MAG: Molybdopterin molybdenumtransferase [Syntrophorhabdus sp. PtaB.Bin047]|jgi:molybdopterin molybdotransferase|nr:MAG: Molybdopterin molybdenumtransferase [Syntrophorhabdus sp. PtaB.Bin047]
MKESRLKNMDEALRLFLDAVVPTDRTERIPLEDADNRVLCKDIAAPLNYPHYDQCILDGYAVRAQDTIGCDARNAKAMSTATQGRVGRGLCMSVHTGSAMPPGADALVPLEDVMEKDGRILVLKEVKEREWVWSKGEGITAGGVVLREGMQLKPTDIAMLAKVGITRVDVYDRPRVLIIPTGDECVGRDSSLSPGFVYEVNGLMCCLLVKRYGGNPTLHDIVPDDRGKLAHALAGCQEYDLVVTIGGSSAGKRDLMGEVVSSMGRVLYHGVAFHPGNHMGAGLIEAGALTRPVAFLPGYTESCAVSAFMFVDPAVRKIGHYPPSRYGSEPVQLTGDLPTPVGIRAVRKVNVRDGRARPVKLIAESADPGTYAYIIVPEETSLIEGEQTAEAVYLE